MTYLRQGARPRQATRDRRLPLLTCCSQSDRKTADNGRKQAQGNLKIIYADEMKDGEIRGVVAEGCSGEKTGWWLW